VRQKWMMLWFAVMLFFGCILAGAPAGATGSGAVHEGTGRQVVLLFAEGLAFSDLEQLRQHPLAAQWLNQAAAAALSIRTPGARSAANAYLLLGSGSQALYTPASGTAYHQNEVLDAGQTAGVRAAERGMRPMQAEIVFPGIFRLLAENQDKPYTASIGRLGSALQARGISASVYGNGDFGEKKQRHAAMFVMDEQGRVLRGDISNRTLDDAPGYPYGRKTNYSYLLERIRADRQAGVIAVQLADLDRLYQAAGEMETGQFARQYQRVLDDLSRFLDQVLGERRENQTVVLLSPAVHRQAAGEKRMMPPILVWNGSDNGLLTSATTRRLGVVSGLDLLPSIFRWLDLSVPGELAGHPMQAESGAGISELFREVDQIHHTYATRPPVLYTYVMLQMITLAVAAFLSLWGKRGGSRSGAERVRRGVRLALLAMLWFPALLLAEAMLPWQASAPVVLGTLILAALLLAFALEHAPLPLTLAVVCGLTTMALLIDGWTGASLMRNSYLGYDPVIGARFYGLGNEYEGVLIGASAMLAAALYQLFGRQEGPFRLFPAACAFAVCLTVLYYMAAPHLGTDAGGFLAGLVAFFVTLSRLEGWKLGKKGLLLLAGGLVGGACLLLAASLFSDQPLTHVGRVSRQILSGEWMEVWRMVERKLAMNLQLMRVSIWSRVFVVSLIVLGLLALWNDRYLRNLAQDYLFLVKGFAGVISGSLAGLALNDSGIVTAATCIVFLVIPALYAALGEKSSRGVLPEGTKSEI